MIGWRHRLNSVATAGLVALLGAAPAMGQTAREVEDVFWQSVVCDRELEVRAYLKTYPDGAYVNEAWACLEQGLGLTRLERVAVQRGLAEVGQEPGPADGLFGGPETKTRRAIRAWQVAKGMAATGYLSREQADILIVTGQAVEERQRAAVAQAAQEEAARQAAAERVAQRRARDAALQVGQTFRDALRSGGEGPAMVVVPAGAFRMGCVSGQRCEDDEYPVHRVTIGSPFAVGMYEVTFAEWEACVRAGGCGGYRPNDEGWGRGRRPVIKVSWEDAQAYVGWLSRESGAEYRLLSEAEWEYVARAGSETTYSWGNEIGKNRANCRRRCGSRWDGERTAPVGSFAANGFGLHDVHGNLMEWVEDCWNESYAGAPTDGTAWTASGDCGRRVLRGGSWGSGPRFLRSAVRLRYSTGYRGSLIGFRVARRLTP